MTKTEQTTRVGAITKGAKDCSGNIVVNVLATGNEYVVYEIETPDINDRLRVLIDGHSDESEAVLTKRYNAVKPKYVAAKGLLYRSENVGLMKNRVAHALASVLSSSGEVSDAEFVALINEIEEERKAIVFNRLLYLVPGVIVASAAALAVYFFFWIHPHVSGQMLSASVLGATLGGLLSLLVRLRDLHFEEFPRNLYLMLGAERIVLAIVAAAVTHILVQAQFILPALHDGGVWEILGISVVAGFSERFVPSLLNKLDTPA